MNIKPLGDRVLVKVRSTEDKTSNGILLPDSAQERKAEGEVIAVGGGENIAKLGLKAGQNVLFGKYAGDELDTDDDTTLKILEDKEILAIIEA